MNPTDDLELFLLALISRGLATPYDFKTQAGLRVLILPLLVPCHLDRFQLGLV
jgi:hypothetical protein